MPEATQMTDPTLQAELDALMERINDISKSYSLERWIELAKDCLRLMPRLAKALREPVEKPANSLPLTMSAEREAQIRFDRNPHHLNEHIDTLLAELDATRAAHAETREQLAQAQSALVQAGKRISDLEEHGYLTRVFRG